MTAYVFLSLLGGGVLGVLGLARMDLMAWKFVRLASILALALLAFVTVASILRPPDVLAMNGPAARLFPWGQVAASVASLVVLTLAPLVERMARPMRVMALAGGVIAVGSACAVQPWSGATAAAPHLLVAMHWVANVLTATLLGSVTLAWLLGHAYLTATRMTITPLRQLGGIFAWMAAARLVFVAASLLAAWLWAQDGVFDRLLGAWLILIVRVLVGLVAVVIFAYMVRECIRIRNTQSATGLLYFASLMAYMGELGAQYLMNELHWPL